VFSGALRSLATSATSGDIGYAELPRSHAPAWERNVQPLCGEWHVTQSVKTVPNLALGAGLPTSPKPPTEGLQAPG